MKLTAKKTILLHPDDATLMGRFVQPGESFEIADEKAAAILVRDGEAATPEAYAAGESHADEATGEDANDEE